MRFACALAMSLWLSLPTAATASLQWDPAGFENSAGQVPTSPAAPAETAPAENRPPQPSPTQKRSAESAPAEQPATEATPAAVNKVPAAATKKRIAGSTSGTRKPRKRAACSAGGPPRKIVVREGGARAPAAQIAPGMTPAEATRQRQNAERLLGSADDQLKHLAGRTLDARQQEAVGQIRNYMDGARSALKEGDVHRADTLAQKAQLLLEDLVGH